MIPITQNQLETILRGISTPTPVEVVAVTNVEMKLTGNPYLGAMKRQVSNVVIGSNYAASVNMQRGMEGSEMNFQASKPVWGTKIPNSCLIEHKGNIYVEAEFLKVKETEFSWNGESIRRESLEKYMPKEYSSKSHQGVETREIIYRRFKLASIKEIKLNGRAYQIV